MILYHFTSAQHLPAIAQHGLTVGDVPTDIRGFRGRIGVWFTSDEHPSGCGLEGSAFDKTRYRLRVDFEETTPNLHRWPDWAALHVEPETITALHDAAAESQGGNPDHWFVLFGVVPSASIVGCYDVWASLDVAEWRDIRPDGKLVPGVPAWRRDAWQRKMMKQVARSLRRT